VAQTVRLGPQGRLVIPAKVRRAAGIGPGDALAVHTRDGQVIIESRENVERRIRERFAHIPSDVDLADELIADRRAEARRELAGG
jgi:AbrB family looped-hinge helix DNA binding protein